EESAWFEDAVNLEQRLLLEAPVEQRHEAPVARDDVEGSAAERQVEDGCFLELDLEIRSGFAKERPGALDHRARIVDSVGGDLTGTRVSPKCDAETAADIEQDIPISNVFGGEGDLEVSKVEVARSRRVVERLRDLVVTLLQQRLVGR